MSFLLRFSRRVALLSLASFALTGSLNATADEQVLKIGVTTGPHEEFFQAVKKVAERDYGLHIRIVAFSDYIQPDAALDAGDIDANSYQHRPFLAAQISASRRRQDRHSERSSE